MTATAVSKGNWHQKGWHRALNAAEVWPEVLSVAAADRDDPNSGVKWMAAIPTRHLGHSVTGFSDPTYPPLSINMPTRQPMLSPQAPIILISSDFGIELYRYIFRPI